MIYQEQILSTIAERLSAIVGVSVVRNQTRPATIGFPVISVDMGTDDVASQGMMFTDWGLTVNLEIYLQSTSDDPAPDTLLLVVRSEAHEAIMKSPTLGLSFVIDTEPQSVTDPIIEAEGDVTTSSVTVPFLVTYRTSSNKLETLP